MDNIGTILVNHSEEIKVLKDIIFVDSEGEIASNREFLLILTEIFKAQYDLLDVEECFDSIAAATDSDPADVELIYRRITKKNVLNIFNTELIRKCVDVRDYSDERILEIIESILPSKTSNQSLLEISSFEFLSEKALSEFFKQIFDNYVYPRLTPVISKLKSELQENNILRKEKIQVMKKYEDVESLKFLSAEKAYLVRDCGHFVELYDINTGEWLRSKINKKLIKRIPMD